MVLMTSPVSLDSPSSGAPFIEGFGGGEAAGAVGTCEGGGSWGESPSRGVFPTGELDEESFLVSSSPGREERGTMLPQAKQSTWTSNSGVSTLSDCPQLGQVAFNNASRGAAWERFQRL